MFSEAQLPSCLSTPALVLKAIGKGSAVDYSQNLGAMKFLSAKNSLEGICNLTSICNSAEEVVS